MAAYRFIHTADVHLDSPLRSLALRNPELAELIGNATRRAFVRTIDLCLEEGVNALVLAGDIYDGNQTSMKTARLLGDQLHRLHAAGIATFIVRGNHDAMSRITKELVFPDTVKVFGGRAEAVSLERSKSDLPIVVHGLSFAQQHCTESLLAKYKPAVEGAVNIGILHTSLAGSPGHDVYSPCSATDLQATDFSYWALGHIHKRSVISGRCSIVMPGIPQGRDIGESGVKSVTLVTIGDDRSVQIEERITSIAQFERVTVDATGVETWQDLVGTLGRQMQDARDKASSEHLVIRLQLTGRTPLYWRARADRDLLKTEIDQRASFIGATWVEKLELECSHAGDSSGVDGNPATILRQLIDEHVIPSEAYKLKAVEIAEEIRNQLPEECRHLIGFDETARDAAIAAFTRDGADEVSARLQIPAGSREN
jgi:exonuclease SbcD